LSAAAFAPSLAAFTPASTLSAAFPANYFAESAAAFAPSLTAFTPASTLSAAFPANSFALSAVAFAPSLTAFTPAATLSAAFPANYLAASPAAFATASIYSLVYFAPASTLSAAFPAALATPDATALPASDTAFPVELTNYLAASAAPAIPFLAQAFNFSPAAAASLTPSTIPFFKSAISDLNLLTMFASHLHKSPLTKVPS